MNFHTKIIIANLKSAMESALFWGPNHHYYCTPGDCTCMPAVKKERRLEHIKFFELKSEGYRDGIKRKETR